ncbi:type II toxin-antitoxin system VapC family toxin [Falsiroseomonas sp. HW251]|uniref:type II toxin-antitoxin system VapC family toxin n=1 Tax=Falsiroseomonas sp. HW251 TaxID=3390998 RepID=UPI003D322C6F
MIVVDTSVWVDFLRHVRSPEAELLDHLLPRRRIIVGDLILCEVLIGLSHEREAARTEEMLRDFLVLPITDDLIATRAARHFRALRAKGVAVRNTIDLLIGTFCLHHGHELLHRDRDFDPMERHLGLRVLHA